MAHGPAAIVSEPSPIATSPTRDDRVLGVELARRELEGPARPGDRLDARQHREPVGEALDPRAALAEDGHHDVRAAAVLVGRQALLEDRAAHGVQLLLGRPDRHHHEHLASPRIPAAPGGPAVPRLVASRRPNKQKSRGPAASAHTRHVPRPELTLRGRSCRARKVEGSVPSRPGHDTGRSGGVNAATCPPRRRRAPAADPRAAADPRRDQSCEQSGDGHEEAAAHHARLRACPRSAVAAPIAQPITTPPAASDPVVAVDRRRRRSGWLPQDPVARAGPPDALC